MGKYAIVVLLCLSGCSTIPVDNCEAKCDPFILGDTEYRPPEQMEDLLERERELQE